MRLLLPLVLGCAFVPGLVLGRRADRSALARSIWRVLYWAGLPVVPIVLAAAPVAAAGPAVLAATASLIALTLLARAYARVRFESSAERAAFTLSAFWPNTGWLGVPVSVAVLGPGAIPTALLYANVASGPHNFLVGGTIAASHRGEGLRSVLGAAVRRNHYLVPTLIGVAWALLDVPHPHALAHVASTWALVSAPLAFFAFGIVIARAPIAPDGDVWAAVLLRVGLSPLLLLATTPFVAIPRAFVLQASMATGLSTLSFAGEHGLPLRRLAPPIAWSTALVLAAACLWALVE
jgi:predicted permease